MATVYLAIQDTFERQVALKVMAEHLVKDESFAARFLREARLVAKMSHQNIVPVFDVGAHENYHYMAMEFLPGGDLKKKMRAGLALIDSVKIVQAVAHGLNYAGTKNLVHRDIKPENILFREDGSPVISDFGIARQADSKTNMTMTGAVIGTPHYMSPEQAEGAEVDPRSDLYSLGIIVYEMLTGHVPFQGDSAVSIGIKHITEDPPPLPPQVAAFQEFIDIALAKHPEDRYQSGADFSEDLAMIAESMTDAEATVVISKEEMQRSSKSGTRAARTSANRSRATSATRSTRATRATRASRVRPGEAPPPSSQSHGRLWLGALAAVGVIGIAGVIVLDPFSDSVSQPTTPLVTLPTSPDKPPESVFGTKAAKLIGDAKAALAEDRLFEPPQNNAQYYLTTLLALVPDSAEGKAAIAELFSRYLSGAETAIAGSQLDEATTYLNQASQISFYIGDEAQQGRFSELYRLLNSQKQRSLISEEKSRLLEDLIARADAALAKDALTAPSENNAYDLFQQVLVEDPENVAAKAGISKIASRFLEKARAKIDEKSFGVAKAFVAAAIQVEPGNSGIGDVQKQIVDAEEAEANKLLESENQKLAELEKARKLRELEIKRRQEQIDGYLSKAEAALTAGNLTRPLGKNALEFFENVLILEPANIAALQGKEKVGQAVIKQGVSATDQGKFDLAKALFAEARKIVSSVVEVSRAERRLQEAEESARIAALVAAGEQALKDNRLTSPAGNNALEYFDRVLKSDPNNLSARQGREKVGMRYLDLSRAEIAKSDFVEAESHLKKAKEISTSKVEIATVERLLEEQRKNVKLDDVIAKAESAFDSGRLTKPDGQSALDYYRMALSVDAQNVKAKAGIQKIEDKYRAFIEQELKAFNFSEAEAYLASWRAFTNDTQAINDYTTSIEQARKAYGDQQKLAAAKRAQAEEERKQREQEAAARKQAQIDTLIAKAKSLESRRRTQDTNNQLRGVYQDILALDSRSREANTGLAGVSDFDARLVQTAIKSKKMEQARQLIDTIRKSTPGYAGLNGLESAYNDALANNEEFNAFIQRAEELINVPYKKPGLFGNNDKARSTLVNAYRAIEDARKILPAHSKVSATLQKLDAKYGQIVGLLMREGDLEEAGKFVSDTNQYQWPGEQMAGLSKQLAEKQSAQGKDLPRAIGAF